MHIRRLAAILLAGALLGPLTSAAFAPPPQSEEQTCPREFRPVSPPLTELGSNPYTRMDGQSTGYIGGLYPGGSNVPPAAHLAAGLALSDSIVPLHPDGTPDAEKGRIALVSVGMSNTQAEFQRFMDVTHRDPRVNPKVVPVNGALSGQTADRWVDPEALAWEWLEMRLTDRALTPLQVQVAFIKQTHAGGGAFPDKAQALQADLEAIVHNLHARFPNLKLVFLSSRTRSYLYERGLSPEPVAFETAFAVRWLIEAQIAGDPELNYDPARGEVTAPFLAWGPYLWIDGETPRADGRVWTAQNLAVDCVHPSLEGRDQVAEMLVEFFLNDPLAAAWYPAGAFSSPVNPQDSPTPPPSPTPEPPPTGAAPGPASPQAPLSPDGARASLPPVAILGGAALFILGLGLGAALMEAIGRRRS